jgi:hypothetical protein
MTSKTNDRITISGTAPKYDESVLKQRQSARHNAYDQTDECTTLIRSEIPIQFLSNLIDHHTKGYTLRMNYPVSIGFGSYSCRMEKPDSIKLSERQALDAQVKLDYIAWLESEHGRYKKLLTAQLLETSELKEAEKIEKAKAKLLADIMKEVDATFSDLVIPE